MILLCCCSVSHIFPQLSSSTVEMKKRMCRCVQPALNSSKWKAGELLLIFCCSRENLRQHGCATVATPQGVRCREAGCRPGEDMVLGDGKTMENPAAGACKLLLRDMTQVDLLFQVSWSGYGSIPVHTIFRGMNIHLPAILMFTRGTKVLTHCQVSTGFSNTRYLMILVPHVLMVQWLPGWWFGTCFIFPYIGNNNPNWLSYFSEGLKPPTRYELTISNYNIEKNNWKDHGIFVPNMVI